LSRTVGFNDPNHGIVIIEGSNDENWDSPFVATNGRSMKPVDVLAVAADAPNS
jgi:hypothetical protein